MPKRLLTLTALLVVAMLCVPAAEVGAQEGEEHGAETIFTIPYDQFIGAALSPDGSRVLIWRWLSLQLWDVESARLVAKHEQFYPVHYRAALWNGDGSRIVVRLFDENRLFAEGERSSSTSLLLSADGEILTTLEHDAPVINAEWSPDGTRLLTYSSSGCRCEENCVNEMRIWDANGQLTAVLRYDDMAEEAVWNTDGTHFVLRPIFWTRNRGSLLNDLQHRLLGEPLALKL